MLAVRVLNASPLTVSFLSDRTKIPAPGFGAGQDGMLGSVTLNGKPINPKQMVVAQPGDLIGINRFAIERHAAHRHLRGLIPGLSGAHASGQRRLPVGNAIYRL